MAEVQLETRVSLSDTRGNIMARNILLSRGPQRDVQPSLATDTRSCLLLSGQAAKREEDGPTAVWLGAAGGRRELVISSPNKEGLGTRPAQPPGGSHRGTDVSVATAALQHGPSPFFESLCGEKGPWARRSNYQSDLGIDIWACINILTLLHMLN
jgi:hypothetical protein